MEHTKIETLKERLVAIKHLGSAYAALHWDMETAMPPKGAVRRGQVLSELSGRIHNDMVSLDNDGLLSELKKELDAGTLEEDSAVIVRETWRDFEQAQKLPESFVRELSETESISTTAWQEARAQSNFDMFKPHLKKMVELKRKQAEYIGYEDDPYDALLDGFEPGLTTKELDPLFTNLKEFLVPFIDSIQKSITEIDTTKIGGTFPIDIQKTFNNEIVEKLGFDFEAGATAISTHPFSTSFSANDVRFTSRYDESDVLYALGSSIHECGHALYMQGLVDDQYGNALGTEVSLGIHESQSRFWENNIGQSKAFFRYFMPVFRKYYPKPFDDVTPEDLYEIQNRVSPTLIRVESDEVTYNLHIVIRYEIERAILAGEVEVDGIPEMWNAKVKEYLGLDVPDDAKGCLQDVHWSYGHFGYFPTYTLGNLYSAQIYDAMEKSIGTIEDHVEKGDFKAILNWLRKNIHEEGNRYSAGDLIKKISGKELDATYFTNYIKEKYTELYNI